MAGHVGGGEQTEQVAGLGMAVGIGAAGIVAQGQKACTFLANRPVVRFNLVCGGLASDRHLVGTRAQVQELAAGCTVGSDDGGKTGRGR